MNSDDYILLVEDNDDDAALTMSALKRHAAARVRIAGDGPAALDLLAAEPILPLLILLDLKMPKMDGIEVLKRLRAEARTEKVPVVMLTSSSRRTDMDAAAAAGANGYLVKAVDFKQFNQDMQQIAADWIGGAAKPG